MIKQYLLATIVNIRIPQIQENLVNCMIGSRWIYIFSDYADNLSLQILVRKYLPIRVESKEK